MLSFYFALAAIAMVLVMTYHSLSLGVTAACLGLAFLLGGALDVAGWLQAMLLAAAAITGLLSIQSLRQRFISAPLFKWFKGVLPELSETEQEAIDAGTVWWDGELFSGQPDWNKLLANPLPTLSAEEQAFLDGPVNELCRMADRWNINHNWKVIPEEVTDFIHDNGFLGMIIPKAYGGLELSAVAQTEVITRIAQAGQCIGNYIAVPNSLGPGELLIKYGTDAQRDYYLPRLAKGQELPCFALTGPHAGSDATSLPDVGVVCKGKYNGKELLGIKLNFDKRYITLAPVATLIGLAFRLEDPDHLIGDKDDHGITCALLPRDTKGVEIGRRHMPVGEAFLNGPIVGKDVFIPLDNIIGGVENAGKGWRMLVNCLSVGRCVTLPAVSNAMGQNMTMGTTAYASLRKQFGVAIKEFEGVQKPLARICGYSYIINAARLHTAQSLGFGEKPSVPSAILKYHCTEMSRQIAIDAMDIHGGKAVMLGERNYVADGYTSVPIAITVEGANIMTRNFMIFGQGATRSHPYVLREMELCAEEVNDSTVGKFDDVFFGHVGFAITNFSRSLLLGLSGARFANAPVNTPVAHYFRQLDRLSSAFALVADTTMLSLQSKLKFKEMLSARLGDLLSSLYLGSMVLKHYDNRGCPAEELPLVTWAMDHLLHEYQVAMLEVLQNYPNRALAAVLKRVVFPLGARFEAPSDDNVQQIVKLMTADSLTRQELTSGVFDEPSDLNPLGQVNAVFLESLAVNKLYRKLGSAIKEGRIEKLSGQALIEAGKAADVLSETEYRQLVDFDAKLMNIINVDDFDPSDIIRVPIEDSNPPLRDAS
ncbi:MAG: acyl-CoA dehydrogenase [Pseudomonadales bacterium]|nr:acyl-CoA dehydrogenase [Pseudomonadales bacterium]